MEADGLAGALPAELVHAGTLPREGDWPRPPEPSATILLGSPGPSPIGAPAMGLVLPPSYRRIYGMGAEAETALVLPPPA